MSANEESEQRAVVREVRNSALATLREQTAAMRKAAPRGKLGERVSLLWGEVRHFDGWVEELGGPECAEAFICAKVWKRDSLESIAAENAQSPALMWAFITETEERFQHYLRAQRGVADALMMSVVRIIEGEARVLRNDKGEIEYGEDGKPIILESDLSRDKATADIYMKLAAKLDRDRFGEKTQLQLSGTLTLDAVLGSMEALSAPVPMIRDAEFKREPENIAAPVSEQSIEQDYL